MWCSTCEAAIDDDICGECGSNQSTNGVINEDKHWERIIDKVEGSTYHRKLFRLSIIEDDRLKKVITSASKFDIVDYTYCDDQLIGTKKIEEINLGSIRVGHIKI